MSEIDDFAPEFRDIIREERRRVLQLMKSLSAANAEDPESTWIRLENCVRNGVDLEDEMALPIEERVIGFHWPDQPRPKKSRKAKRKKAP